MRLPRCGFPPLFAAACCVLTSGVHAQDLCQEPAGRFASIDGEADVQSGGVYWRTAQLDQPLCEGDAIRVGDRSRVAIQLINNAVLRIDQNTTIRLVNISGNTRAVLDGDGKDHSTYTATDCVLPAAYNVDNLPPDGARYGCGTQMIVHNP